MVGEFRLLSLELRFKDKITQEATYGVVYSYEAAPLL